MIVTQSFDRVIVVGRGDVRHGCCCCLVVLTESKSLEAQRGGALASPSLKDGDICVLYDVEKDLDLGEEEVDGDSEIIHN